MLHRKAREIREIYEYVPSDDDVHQIVESLLSYQLRIASTFPRFCTRIYAALTPARRQYPPRQLARLVLLGTAVDVVVWKVLSRQGRDDWEWRAPFYGVDAAAWSRFGPNGHFDSIPALMLWPMVLELTHNQNMRSRPRVLSAMVAMVLPVVVDGKIVHRKPVPLFSWRWPVVALGGGVAFRFVLRKRLRATEERLVQGLRLTADAVKAAGSQRAIPKLTTGRESTRDWLDRTRIGQLEELGAVELIADWKKLEEKRNERSKDKDVIELGPLLAAWERAMHDRAELDGDGLWQQVSAIDPHNEGPRFKCSLSPTDLGLHILTARQAAALRHELSTRPELIPEPEPFDDKPAFADVTLDHRYPASPLGEDLHLNVNGHTVAVGRDPNYRPVPDHPFDPTAFAFVLDAIWAINDLRWRPQRTTGPKATAALSVLTAVELTVRQWTGRQVTSPGVMARAIAVQAVGTAASVGKGAAWKSDGSRLVWPVSRAEMPMFIAAAHWGGLSSRQRYLASASIFFIAVAYSVTTGRGRWGRLDVALQALFNVQAIVPAFKLTTWSFLGMEQQLAQLRRDDLREIALQAELDESRHLLTLSQNVYDEASRLLDDRNDDVEEFLLREAERIETLEAQRTRRSMGDFGDGFEAINALPPEASTVIMDIDNTLVPYSASKTQRASAVCKAARLAEELQTIRRLVFISNSATPVEAPSSDTIEIMCITRARKPWIHVRPLRRHRYALANAVVVGDQPLTDGGLARFLDGTFMQVRGFGNEPRWPRFLRSVGEFIM